MKVAREVGLSRRPLEKAQTAITKNRALDPPSDCITRGRGRISPSLRIVLVSDTRCGKWDGTP
jgi:hypothetical protein